jgi:hypothetical protein
MKKASSAESSRPAPRAACQPIVDKRPGHAGLSLWGWVVAGFLFLALLWTGMLVAARQADTRTVPLATKGGRP